MLILLPCLPTSLKEMFAASFLCLLNIYSPSSYRASKLFPLQKPLEHRARCCSDQNNGIFINKLSEIERSNVSPCFVTESVHSGSISSLCLVFKFLFHLFIHICIYVEDTHPTAHVWKLEGNLWESALDVYHVGSGYQTQAVQLGKKLCLLRHCVSTPSPHFLSFALEIELRTMCVC